MSTTVTTELTRALAAAARHPSVSCMALGLSVVVRFRVSDAPVEEQGFVDVLVDSNLVVVESAGRAASMPLDATRRIEITADTGAWRRALAPLPPPLYQSFSAWQLKNQAFQVSGDPLTIAQSRSFLETLIEQWHVQQDVPRLATSDERPSLAGLAGSYHRVTHADGRSADIFMESAGQGPVLLCLHTAGADARQYHGLLASEALTRRHRVMAFDMPSHGRTMPAVPWDGEAYASNQADYLGWCVAVLEQVIKTPVTVLGCSMGAAMALVLAAERPDLLDAVIALEAPVRPRGRRNAFLTHAQVNGGWHSSAYVRGLMSPSSPILHRRGAAWIYAQGAPGVYDGDLAFYSDEFDGEMVARRIDGIRTPVVLMSGDYDFSATLDDAHALGRWIEGSRVVEMPGLGHFPMTEHPAALLAQLLPELDRLGREAVGHSLPREPRGNQI